MAGWRIIVAVHVVFLTFRDNRALEANMLPLPRRSEQPDICHSQSPLISVTFPRGYPKCRSNTGMITSMGKDEACVYICIYSIYILYVYIQIHIIWKYMYKKRYWSVQGPPKGISPQHMANHAKRYRQNNGFGGHVNNVVPRAQLSCFGIRLFDKTTFTY